MRPINADQSQQIMFTLSTNVNWSNIDFDALDLQNRVILKAKEAGEQFEAFLKNGCRLIVGEPQIVTIDRTKPFNPARFIGPGWSFWKGPANGDGLKGKIERDARSLKLKELNTTKILLECCLKPEESYTNGEERIKRLDARGRIRLDLGIFQTFWNNKTLIPESFKKKTNGSTTSIFFDGQPLRSPDGGRCALYFCLSDDGEWRWCVYELDGGRSSRDRSAVLAS